MFFPISAKIRLFHLSGVICWCQTFFSAETWFSHAEVVGLNFKALWCSRDFPQMWDVAPIGAAQGVLTTTAGGRRKTLKRKYFTVCAGAHCLAETGVHLQRTPKDAKHRSSVTFSPGHIHDSLGTRKLQLQMMLKVTLSKIFGPYHSNPAILVFCINLLLWC